MSNILKKLGLNNRGNGERNRRRRKIGVVEETVWRKEGGREAKGTRNGEEREREEAEEGREEMKQQQHLDEGHQVGTEKEREKRETEEEIDCYGREGHREAKQAQLMATRKLSKSTSDLPGNGLLTECQGFDRWRGAREEVATTNSDGEENRQRTETKRRKKSFKICKFVVCSELLVWNRSFPTRQSDDRPTEKSVPQRMPMVAEFGGGIGGTRFKITPVENKYKRGRWEVWDYYEDGVNNVRGNAPSGEPLPLPPSFLPPSQFLLPQSALATAPAGQTPSASQCHPPLMPRRNSFQLIKIRNTVEEVRNASEPISISKEKLNKSASENEAKSPLHCPLPLALPSPSPRLPPSHFQLFSQPSNAQLPAISDLSRTTTPQIVEPTNGEEAKGSDQQKGTSGKTRSSRESDETERQRSFGVLRSFSSSDDLRLISPSSPQYPEAMLLNQFGLEQSLSLGVGNVLMCPSSPENGKKQQMNCAMPTHFGISSPVPTTQQTLSASFGHGQTQFEQQKGRKISGETRAAIARRSSSASTGAVPAAQKGDGVVAIDSKIEQAMDLVKSHLIYAVRDEIELLRARIVNLEATVIRLETENAILREHIPRDVLERISLPQHFSRNASSIAPIAQ